VGEKLKSCGGHDGVPCGLPRGARRGEVALGVKQSTRTARRRQPDPRGAVFHNVGTVGVAASIWPGPNIVTGGSRGERLGERSRRSCDPVTGRAWQCQAPCGWGATGATLHNSYHPSHCPIVSRITDQKSQHRARGPPRLLRTSDYQRCSSNALIRRVAPIAPVPSESQIQSPG
jgi:hypothetical protein